MEFKKKYRQFARNIPGVTASHIGLGTEDTMHGTPDMRINCCNVLWAPTVLMDGDSSHDDDPSSDNDSDNDVEGKKTFTYAERNQEMEEHLHQLVAMSVVCSFTQYNISKQPMKATILLNSSSFRVCFYDCINDVLLLSSPKKFYKVAEKALSRSGVLLLWICIHDRYEYLTNSAHLGY